LVFWKRHGFLFCFIGRPEDPRLIWEGGDYNGNNIPNPEIDLFTTNVLTGAEARRLLESVKYGGRVLDWGASGAILTKDRILGFLNEMPEAERTAAVTMLDTLTDGTEYVLFAWEV
jgi:hypothetical protein